MRQAATAVTVRGALLRALLGLVMGLGVIGLMTQRVGGIPPVGSLLDPADGLWRTARKALPPPSQTLTLPALRDTVQVLRDERGVPHIFAPSDRGALMALGYVVAQDRLFQLDFIPRVAAGRLSEVFGADALPTDRFLRRIGMDWGARRNAERIREEGGIEAEIIDWFAEGVNAYIESLAEDDLPFEFRLLGYQPERYSALQATRVLQYMNYDLTFRRDALDYAHLRERLGERDYRVLYPAHPHLAVPITPTPPGLARTLTGTPSASASAPAGRPSRSELHALAEGFQEGKGSNNWAVHGPRSATGAPLLAGDMHLSVTLPAIWYEAHLVTPTMNSYGVTIPGAPVLVEAFNEHLGWTFTNTGGDVVDHYQLVLNADSTAYRYEGAWRPIERVLDTLHVRGAPPVIDTLRYSHWGPMVTTDSGAVAIRWTAHEPSRTLRALWDMGQASSYATFEDALRRWDTPMQNILYAGTDSVIAIRSTGYMPIRASGTGEGLLDGTTASASWTGRIPFEALPHAINPAWGFLTSTNQVPADSTYPYYLGHDWRSVYRSMRIDQLLRTAEQHDVNDLKRYQADVNAVQRDLVVPLLDSLSGLPPRSDTLRSMLSRWEGTASVDRPEPLILHVFLDRLRDLAWDEPVFDGLKRPSNSVLMHLLRANPQAAWFDVGRTPQREDAAALLRKALGHAADSLAAHHGWSPAAWRWGEHHGIVFRHLTQSPALRALWRGPVPYPGFASTLSPAGDRQTTHSASWRVVVDFSTDPPTGYGIYPGGQSGNPFSPYYDLHLPSYVRFKHYDLHMPRSPEDLDAAQVASTLDLVPGDQQEAKPVPSHQ